MSPKKTAESTDPENTSMRPTSAVVSKQYFQGKTPTTDQETKNEQLKVGLFVTEPAKVSVSQGLTLNLGNYESARIEVSIAVPCYREEVDDAYRYAISWVEDRLSTEVSSVRKNKPNLF